MSPPDIVKNRWLGFLIWQSIAGTAIYVISSLLLPFPSIPVALLSFLAFHLSLLLLLSLALFLLSSPHPEPHASLLDLAASLLRVSLRSILGGFAGAALLPDARRRARRTLAAVLFIAICSISGLISVVSVWRGSELIHVLEILVVGLQGSVFGLVYGIHYLYNKRWILRFPIIQRPLFYSFKLGIWSSMKQALKLSTLAFFCSTVLVAFLPDQFNSRTAVGKFIVHQINFYIATCTVSFCWEFSYHLLQIVHTRRFIFAPLQGSAAAETNPSEPLLDALEQSSPRSLMQYLAYLDLCMVSESNVEPWRRAAFFEESGETYRRLVSVCLRPLEQLTSELVEGLEGFSADKADLFAQQLSSSLDARMDSRLHEAFNDFQLCTWCARTVGALTARSHWEDRYGVAQLTGCNISVVSTLLSCLLAVEACLGKKTSSQPAHLMSPTSIRWATMSTARRDGTAAITIRKRGGILYSKAYAMADVLRTSIYQIVSAFESDMQANLKAAVLEKNWISDSKPLYGSREILLQKLSLFLQFRAT